MNGLGGVSRRYRIHHEDVDAPVVTQRCHRVGVADGIGFPTAHHHQTVLVHALSDEHVGHVLSSATSQRLIVIRVAAVVGTTDEHQLQLPIRLALEAVCELQQLRMILRARSVDVVEEVCLFGFTPVEVGGEPNPQIAGFPGWRAGQRGSLPSSRGWWVDARAAWRAEADQCKSAAERRVRGPAVTSDDPRASMVLQTTLANGGGDAADVRLAPMLQS